MSLTRDQDLRSGMPVVVDGRAPYERPGRASMQGIALSPRDPARRFATPIRLAIGWWRSDATQDTLRRAMADLFESGRRLARKTHMPTRQGMLTFFWNQVLINAVAWTAGVVAAGLVRRFFEVRGFRNLWGLTASSTRSLVSADDYQTIMLVASYSAGLAMLILMRHIILRLIAEVHLLRTERASSQRSSDRAPAAHDASAPPSVDSGYYAVFGGTKPGSGARSVAARRETAAHELELISVDPTDD